VQNKRILSDFQYISRHEISIMPAKYNLIAVIGPTASGKTAFAAQLACRINGEVISADSRQVYRQMNLGTGKDYADYVVGGIKVPVHLTDIAEPGYKYSIFEYQRDFASSYSNIVARGKFPVLCGGSGMYIAAVTRKYRLDEVPRNETLREELSAKNPDELRDILASLKKLHNKTDVDTVGHALRAIEIEHHYRAHPSGQPVLPDINPLFIGILFDRETERKRITERLSQRLQHGMIEEVTQLLESGVPAESLTYYGLEYRYITLFLQGKLDYQTMASQLGTAIHQFAKRQRTWFRKMEREGCIIHWLDGNLLAEVKMEKAMKLMSP
jgi:tRNA dimethylallyltransferase